MNVTFRTIMVRNINASWFREDQLQEDVFMWNEDVDDPDRRCRPEVKYNEENLEAFLEPCSNMQTFDYFTGSSGPYIGTFVALGLYLLLNIAILVLATKYFQQKSWKSRSARDKKVHGPDLWSNAGVFTDTLGNPLVAHELKVILHLFLTNQF